MTSCSGVSPGQIEHKMPHERRVREMNFVDKILTCVECKAEFIFTSGEQRFYAEKNFTHEPKRCSTCRRKRGRESFARVSTSQGATFPAVCADCRKETTVPFQPIPGQEVFCSGCFRARRANVHADSAR